MKIFHSMALANRTAEERNTDRSHHYKWIKENYPDAELLNTFIDEIPPDVKHVSVWYFGKGLIDSLSITDLLVIPYNWYNIRGVRCQKFIAEQYDIPVVVMPKF